MLLAEIHGKRSEAIESNEDYLTSAIFGHLRQVKEGTFWRKLFRKAGSVDGSATDLMTELEAAGAHLEDPCDLKILFWPATQYGEPDLILHFRNKFTRSIVILVEVKLHSDKSSVVPDDQLCRYFRLLHDGLALDTLLGQDLSKAELGLIYLTERFSAAEVMESIQYSEYSDAGRRMFPLQWQDITEILREMRPAADSLLGEVLQFLARRQYEHFQGFQKIPASVLFGSGHFYSTTYFNQIAIPLDHSGETWESFYGK